jgi:CelD/BcsL family acetyltransferase involved in cellulose biosynthesis
LIAALQVNVLNDISRWDDLRDEWDELFAVSQSASPPMHFVWMREWWRVYSQRYGRGGLRIFTFRRGGRLVGVLPLYRQVRGAAFFRVQCLRFISTGEDESEETCPDYLDLLAIPGEESACLNAFRDTLFECRHEWDELVLCDISQHSSLTRIPELFAATSWKVDLTDRGACPIAELGQGFEQYIGQLSAKSRRNTRQHIREATRAGAVLELAVSEIETKQFFTELVRLHQARWTEAGKTGCFAAMRFLAFQRDLANRWVPAGKAVLARLRCKDETCAVIYGFISGGKHYFYQSGVAHTSEHLKSPGITANLLLMEFLSRNGIVEYDFLRGDSAYKQWLSTKHVRLCQLRAVRPCLRNGARSAIRRAVLTTKRCVRTFVYNDTRLASEPTRQ